MNSKQFITLVICLVFFLGASTALGQTIEVDPTEFDVTLDFGMTDYTEMMTISNTGDADLTYSIAVEFDDNRATVTPKETIIGQESDVRKGDDVRGTGTPSLRGSGGPDWYGYSWIDSDEGGGPSYEWNDISESGTLITGLGDDTNVGPFDLGFDFDYYGQTFNSIRFCTNGFAT
ncbi:MAG: hypothetical protein D6675_11350, partial [Gemmatimonadetes bacterium]